MVVSLDHNLCHKEMLFILIINTSVAEAPGIARVLSYIRVFTVQPVNCGRWYQPVGAYSSTACTASNADVYWLTWF